MQIIGGEFKGRKLFTLPGRATRPTSGKVREAVFNILAGAVAGARVADLFAGTGAMGIEALSRGAQHAVFVEADRRAVEVIRKNVAACRARDRADIFCRDLCADVSFLKRSSWKFDLVFMDPPYSTDALSPALANLAASSALAPGALLVIEHARSEPLPEDLGLFAASDQRRYGKTLVSFLEYMVASRESGNPDDISA